MFTMHSRRSSKGDGVIRSRAACWLLVGSMTALFGCSAGTEHSVAKPSSGSIGIAAPARLELGVRAARVGDVRSTTPEITPATTQIAPSTTIVEPPVAEPPAAPETTVAASNELVAAPTTTTTAKPVVARTAATPTTAALATPVAAPLAPAAAPSVVMDPAAASDMAARTNGVRSSVGLAALARNGSLDAMAADWARELALSGALRHSSSPNGAVASGWSIAGENVGYGSSPVVVHEALVGSAGHYANLVGDRYTNIGVGAARSADGRLWVCEVFAG